jgi:hypothetical protein
MVHAGRHTTSEHFFQQQLTMAYFHRKLLSTVALVLKTVTESFLSIIYAWSIRIDLWVDREQIILTILIPLWYADCGNMIENPKISLSTHGSDVTNRLHLYQTSKVGSPSPLKTLITTALRWQTELTTAAIINEGTAIAIVEKIYCQTSAIKS